MITRPLKPALGLAIIAVTLLGFPGCNEQQIQDALRREGMELQQNARTHEEQLSPLTGRYTGTLRHPDGTEKPVVLTLVPTIIVVQNPGRNDVTQYPSLAGTLSVILPPLRDGDPEDWIAIAAYDMADFDPARSRLTLTGSTQSSSIGLLKMYFDGIVSPDYFISARISTSLRGNVGTLELRKEP